MTDSDWFEEAFAGAPLMAILRGMGVERSARLATTAWDLGLDSVEVPLQTDEDERALRELVRLATERGKVVGAGTVITTEQVERAAAAGAAYLVSPGIDPVDRARGAGARHPDPSRCRDPVGGAARRLARADLAQGVPRRVARRRLVPPHPRPVPAGALRGDRGARREQRGVVPRCRRRVAAVGSALEDATQLDALAAVLREAR